MSTKAQSGITPLKVFSVGFVVIWLVIASFPFLWTLWGSFKVQSDFFSRADWTNALYGIFTRQETGGAFTTQAYTGAWIDEEFWRAVLNTAIVVFFTVIISLTFGTLGGYALARSGFRYAFWLLMLALVFRAMPHITLVSGYLLPFFEWNIWGILPTTIIVLVAINQPFTLWMLHSFFKNIPKDLDESAMVDGCTRFQAFRYVIIPVMWPGVITTGLFSFLLAYNDFAVTAMLLSSENQTMIPAVVSFLGTTQEAGNVMFAVASVVSATAPLFVLVLFFQRQIVSGLTAGAVKGTLWGSFKVQSDFFSRADWTNALYGIFTRQETGGAFTTQAYTGAWIDEEFWRAVLNTAIVVFFTVIISLTFGTLGGYALARSGFRYAFWLLMLALVFRAMPHITLVSGYLLPFFEWNIWGILPTTIIVLVAINQPFTLWMLHSFFKNIPKDLDESAMVDGCTRFQAGVITTGLFSFLLAYNDFAVTAMLLSSENQTMIPAVVSFLGTTQEAGNVMFAVASVVSATAPLFVLVLFFQRQIVSGLTAGAVKG
jgi:ABC-type glycerol-3-phosphate transport system permease component